ncbi:MAG: putative baseplate assembly protein [Anaerolineales bacterium]|nr:putative baseplate assembly protein [Anaerolineales bacterium]
MSAETPLDRCGCCEGPAPPTPEKIDNRPGLSRIRYRMGTYASFREAMIEDIAKKPRLRQWTARDSTDFGIAFLEMWAYLSDILTFYQERIANEAFLRTAVLRDSILHIAALIGYRPAPGVAATTYLTFTLEKGKQVKIPVGLKVQSVPGQDEKPQKFETVEAITADAELNEVRVLSRPRVHNPFAQESTQGVLLTDPDAIAEGDKIVIFDHMLAELKKASSLTEEDVQVVFEWEPAIQTSRFRHFSTSLAPYDRIFRLFGHDVPTSYLKPKRVSGKPREVLWEERKEGTDYFYKVDDQFAAPVVFELDARYEDLKAGTNLLLVQADSGKAKQPFRTRRASIRAVDNATASLGPTEASVTQVTMDIGVRGRPRAALDKDGSLHCFVLADDGSLWRVKQKPKSIKWETWKSFGGDLKTFALGSNEDERLEVFAIDRGGAVWHIWQKKAVGEWSRWASFGVPKLGVKVGQIAVGRNKDGRLEIFAGGTDGSLWHRWQIAPNDGWSGWHSLGKPSAKAAVGQLAIGSNKDGRLEVFTHGSDGRIWHIWQVLPNDGWSKWSSLGAPSNTVGIRALDVHRNEDGRLEVFVCGTDGRLWHRWQSPWIFFWLGWHTLGMPDIAEKNLDLAVGRSKNGRLEVFTRTESGKLWHIYQLAPNSGWSAWNDRGLPKANTKVSDLIVESNHDGRFEVFVRGSDNALFHIPQLLNNAPLFWFWLTRGVPMWPVKDRRKVTVYELSGPRLKLWNRRYWDSLAGSTIYARWKDLKKIGSNRTLLLDDKKKKPVVAIVSTAKVVDTDQNANRDHLAITLQSGIDRQLDYRTAVLYGNVVKATHGETIASEILGSGDASQTFQDFELTRKPVTFVPDAYAPNGAANTLKVWVDDVLWNEKQTLYGSREKDRIFTTQVGDDGVMKVQFGDGKTGSRLPTGRGNIIASYRQGIGKDGNVKAGSISTLLDRPVGLKEVINPAPAVGGSEPESLKKARRNAPNTVRTFDRIVSLRDFEDAAREFSGVSKALAIWEWAEGEMTVYLTVAGDKHGIVSDTVLGNLRRYLNSRRDPNRNLVVRSYKPVPLEIKTAIRLKRGQKDDKVLAACRRTLLKALSFESLDIGQSIHLSDIFEILQNVNGVLAVDVDRLMFKARSSMTTAAFMNDLKKRYVRFSLQAGILRPDPVQAHLRIWATEMAYIANSSTDISVYTGMKAA